MKTALVLQHAEEWKEHVKARAWSRRSLRWFYGRLTKKDVLELAKEREIAIAKGAAYQSVLDDCDALGIGKPMKQVTRHLPAPARGALYRAVLLGGGKVFVRGSLYGTRKEASAELRRLLAVTPGAEDAVVVVAEGRGKT